MMMMMIHKQSNENPYLGFGLNDHHLTLYSSPFADSINPHPLKPDTRLTYTLPLSTHSSSMSPFSNAPNPMDRCTSLAQHISSQIQLQQQLEIDHFVSRHTEKVRADVQESRNRYSRTIIAALEEGIMQRLRAKEEEIVKMAKLNWALEERVKSLCIENQIWRELAQTNEATANALCGNLKQLLEQLVQDDYRHRSMTVGEDDAADDAQSCCESNNEKGRTLAEQDSSNSNMKRWCKNCGKAESCVLLLPCRHLCLCTACTSSVDICPICKSTKNISVHVHMS